MKNIIGYISLIIIFAAMLLIALFVVKETSTPNVIKLNSLTILNKTPIKSGDEVTLQLDYCKYLDYESDITVTFANSSLLPSYNLITDLTLGCNKKTFILTLPESAKGGQYVVGLKDVYNTNPPFGGSQYIIFSHSFDLISK